jgi:hypothetical protein
MCDLKNAYKPTKSEWMRTSENKRMEVLKAAKSANICCWQERLVAGVYVVCAFPLSRSSLFYPPLF